jgi:lactate permease
MAETTTIFHLPQVRIFLSMKQLHTYMELLLAITPLILLVVLLIFLRRSAAFSMPITWAASALIAISYWQMQEVLVLAGMVKGLFVAIDIVFIVFGALVLLETLECTKCIKGIRVSLGRLSKDHRVQAILVAWCFGAFIEGAAGFGAAPALAAPLLVGLGFGALPAIVISLIANSVPVSFGAIGVPLTIGIASVTSENLAAIGTITAGIHGIIGTLIPLLISCFTSKYVNKKSFFKGFEIWQFALFSGLSFTIPLVAFSILLPPEFPSFLGGLVSLFVTAYAARKGWFLKKSSRAKIKIWPFAPYLIAGLILAISRLPFAKRALGYFEFEYTQIFGTEVSASITPLLNPGLIFLLVALLTILYLDRNAKRFVTSIQETSKAALKVFIVLGFAASLVQVYLLSATNLSGLPSMPAVVAHGLALSGGLYPLLSPLLGLLGGFITGSNTVSNLLFGPFQIESALTLGLSSTLILALQNVGGAIGNMISPQNIIAASATVGYHGGEGEVMRKTILPALGYALLAGIIGLILASIFYIPK